MADFIEQLRDGPGVLFLGQHYLALETGIDPLLAATARKFGPASVPRFGYQALLDSEFSMRYDLNLWIGDPFEGATYLPR